MKKSWQLCVLSTTFSGGGGQHTRQLVSEIAETHENNLQVANSSCKGFLDIIADDPVHPLRVSAPKDLQVTCINVL